MRQKEEKPTVEIDFDRFVESKNKRNFGFFNNDQTYGDTDKPEWSKVVWIARVMIDDGRVKVERRKDAGGKTVGFTVTMSAWLAEQKELA